ncbi:AraC family transcriptional regulator [Rhodococcus sp. IEGM 1406]|uniref:AraC family transcriptional regulator n=1 Tax=Rhodococcus sp. IEGM 1406 TaxID=3047083 RepID=UPI0024B69DD1|nr:AraC family transcriptional regulator [Rhodococcus sp. IEGM 1406]MDI9904492.1 AraC family transcriptional regulator [Rhodococcus sp. IEGM 1406]
MVDSMIGTAPRDWDEACDAVSDAYFPHTLTPLSRHAASGVGVCTAELGPLRIAHIRWGADVAVESEHPGAYGVNIPLSGELESVFAGSHVLSTEGVATVCPPDITTRITRWSADCEIVGVRMDRQYLDREMEKVLGRPGMHLPDQVDLRGDDGARWLKFVRSLSDQILGPVGVLHNELVAAQLSGAVVTAFVLAAMPESEDAVRHARPRIVKRVLDEMHDDPARVWTAAEMAEVAGVSVRRLQEGFRQYVGRSPSECLLDIRLERVHADLVDADDSTTVTDVAVRWGFTHTGRFASSFRRKYGVLPSEVFRS